MDDWAGTTQSAKLGLTPNSWIRKQEPECEVHFQEYIGVRKSRTKMRRTFVTSKAQRAEVPTEQDPRWQAIVTRDGAFDGKFLYSVKSTGIYCRPSCPSRLANPKNVEFHLNQKAAERRGFRPCRRCKPDQPGLAQQHAAVIADICRALETADEVASLKELARKANMSPFHFHRVFKSHTGLTPKAYAIAQRAKRVRDELTKTDTSVTSAIYGAGFNSNGRFYETSDKVLGMKPTDYRAGGTNAEIQFAIGECSLGSILVARSQRGVCAVLLGDDPDALARELQDRFPQANLIGGDAGFENVVAKVVGFVEAPALGLDLPLDVRGTAFQQRVWRAVQEIPAGVTASYAEIAKRIGSPRSVRAVAQACAANIIAVAIPCHRVVRTDDVLSGYRWGVARKRSLLEREST
jgi:AraC family transcriptional regulator, regulatory protein of adaptative response / methylated-DNA-[protein]-cysteine methyltransferase